MSTLISAEYLEQQRELHENPDYGTASVHYAPLIDKLINQLEITELLDYGCGKGRLEDRLRAVRPSWEKSSLLIRRYDPVYIDERQPTEMVCCIDVLEHIEPDCLDNVLDDLQRLTQRIGVFTVHTGQAAKSLPDGRNAHLIQENYRWWLPKIMERFEVFTLSHEIQGGFYVIVRKLAVGL